MKTIKWQIYLKKTISTYIYLCSNERLATYAVFFQIFFSARWHYELAERCSISQYFIKFSVIYKCGLRNPEQRNLTVVPEFFKF